MIQVVNNRDNDEFFCETDNRPALFNFISRKLDLYPRSGIKLFVLSESVTPQTEINF